MRNPIRKCWVLFGVTFGVILIASGAYIAQAGRDDSPPPADASSAKKPEGVLNLTDDELQEVVQVLNLYTLDKDLGLSDDQLVRVLPKWRKITEMRGGFWHDRRARMGDLKRTLAAHKKDPSSVDEAALCVDVDTFHQTDSEFWAQHGALRDALLDELTPAQKVGYILIENRQGSRSRRLITALKRINRTPQPEAVADAPVGKDTKPTTVATTDQ